MVALLLASLLVGAAPADTATFADARTESLYYIARARHLRQDSIVRDYQATVHTRIDATAGRSRFARLATLWVHESEADIAWHAPNDLKISVRGARTKVPVMGLLPELRAAEAELREEFRGQVLLDRPWFIPRSLGDSIRLMGLPTVAALHPLAPGAEAYYRFAVLDSARLRLPGREVRTARLRVEPKAVAPALVAGHVWLDVETGDVVRMRLLFLGEYLWDSPEDATPDDSLDAQATTERVMRHVTLEAELEYVLVNSLYWMPYRQYLGITAEIPIILNLTVPARAVSTFSNYRVNTGRRVGFTIPDSLLEADGDAETWDGDGDSDEGDEGEVGDRREARRDSLGYARGATWRDGRWEVSVPPRDSVAAYDWPDELATEMDPAAEARLAETIAELAALEDRLPSEWTNRRRFRLAWEKVSEVVRFNRVQGLSLGAGIEIRPRIPHTSLLLGGRMGLSDLRPLGSVTVRHDGPGGRLDVAGYRTMREAEPWTSGLGIGNSLNALFTAHDDADYFLATGGSFTWIWNRGLLRDVHVTLAYERHDSVQVESGSAIADLWGTGTFQPNPPVDEEWFGSGAVTLNRRIGPVGFGVGASLLTDWARVSGRGWMHADVGFRVAGRSGRLAGRLAAMRGDVMPQTLWRVGGPQTVRGYTYGTRTGRYLWSLQLDMALTRSAIVTPVAFVDAGDTFVGDPLVGVGGGLSILRGLIRFNVSAGVRPKTEARFDLMFRAPR
jgi:hypothetical protein